VLPRVDDTGQPVFHDLFLRRRQCVFTGFDLLYLNGKDNMSVLRPVTFLACRAFTSTTSIPFDYDV
jgi:hypothetical protein